MSGGRTHYVKMLGRVFELCLSECQKVGRAGECEKLHKEFLEKAGQAFAKHEDKKAHWLRELAEEMSKRGALYRDQQHITRRQLTNLPDIEEIYEEATDAE